MHIGAGRLHADFAGDLAQAIEGMVLTGIQNDADGDSAPVGIDQDVDDNPIRQRIGRQVDLGASRMQQPHVHALQVLNQCVMDFYRFGAGAPRERQ
jgi:hypothetical protein